MFYIFVHLTWQCPLCTHFTLGNPKKSFSTVLFIRHGTASLGHRVNGSFGSSFTSGSPGHHFDPVWDPSFSGFRKNAQKAKRTFEMLKWQKHCHVSVVGLKSLDVSLCNKLLLLPMIIKNSLAWEYFFVTSMTSLLDIYVHIEQGHRVNWISGSLDFRVTGSQNVT